MRHTSERGFTLIELLMVILLVAILAAVAIPQFLDFRTEARNAAVQSAAGTLRTGIALQYGQMRLRCDVAAPLVDPVGQPWPTTAQVNANSILTGGNPCTAAEIPAGEEQFVAGAAGNAGLPENPWSAVAANSRVIATCAGAGCNNTAAARCDAAAFDDAVDSGWCYNPATGRIWANSSRNPANTEWSF